MFYDLIKDNVVLPVSEELTNYTSKYDTHFKLKHTDGVSFEFLCVTCSNGLLVLIPFPPTKIQLSRKPKLSISELPRSAISFLASTVSLHNKRRQLFHSHTIDIMRWFKQFQIDHVHLNGSYFVEESSNEAIITIVPSSISFRNLMKGATSTQGYTQLTQHVLCF